MRCAIFGASGAIGGALARTIKARGYELSAFSRSGPDPVDILNEKDLIKAADKVGGDLDLVVVATGFLHDARFTPEKAIRQISADHLQRSFAVNAIGPALVMKHFLPNLAKGRRVVFAAMSARVGSISDNSLGGWYSYRASKAALNQLIKTAAVELVRTRPLGICVGLHPGTVETPLSAPFHKSTLAVKLPNEAGAELVTVLDGLTTADSGGFFDYAGKRIDY
jgi:NAD(P)-dependent dehydrogenase (short-subunit alcohol dehydrogenase family)